MSGSSYNGPVSRGYYSDDGTINKPCPPGTYQPSLYAEECLPCQPGSYCATAAIGRFDGTNNLCPAGYQCLEGTINYLDATKCSTGYISELGSPNCIQCQDGYYSTDPAKCVTCPPGSYCNTTSTSPQLCKQQLMCKGGNPVDPPCGSGTYLPSTNGLCTTCVAGSYCTGGVISGKCTAGHLCDKGSSTPIPDAMCSPGYYCPIGATSMTACPSGYFRSTRGGIQYTDCAACEPGFICTRGSDPVECPKGSYCPIGTTSILSCP